ncbi:MAG TPA: ATP-binding protein, partial [Arthrobacter bacterium]|nr:ATP-binding protein [Arthrobacter sp.]
KALKATVSTFPVSDYDLEETLTSAGIGEAVITVMNENGAPTPVALTRLRAPESVMGPSTDDLVKSTVAGSALLTKYGTAVDNVSAFEKLTGKGAAATGEAAPGEPPVPGTSRQADVDAEARRIEQEILGRPSSRPAPAPERGADAGAPSRRAPAPAAPAGGGIAGDLAGVLGGGLKSMVRSLGTQLGRELLRGVFGTSSRRRR